MEKSLRELNFDHLTDRPFFPSPAAWEDEVLYFLMLDRFSDGRENHYHDNQGQLVTTGQTPIFTSQDAGNAVQTEADRQQWIDAGSRFVGGTLAGLESKIGYLKRLGITAIWISPIFKQNAFEQTYHGYGIQNYIDVDPRFGSREDLKRVVQTAHRQGIRIILDIILNHSGDVFAYDPDRYDCRNTPQGRQCDPRWDGRPYKVAGYRDSQGQPVIPFEEVDLNLHPQAWPDGAIWPAELQPGRTFTQKGRINSWDYDPEYREGDFFSLKDIHLGDGPIDDYAVSPALNYLCEVYKFWIAWADIDGFRVDTVKHMDGGATRYFTSVIHEFAQSLGKENFYLIGEITGGRENAFNTLEATGLNAALGINDIPDRLEYLVKGYRQPEAYFSLFRNSLLVQKESHVWFKNKVVTTFDDHDQVRKGQHKARFCYDESPGQQNEKLVFNVVALMATTLGIPCIYYGTEQAFNGHGDSDRYLREAMFGGSFGAFESQNRHFFDEETTLYKKIFQLLVLRQERIELRRGRQYLRPISGNGVDFGLPMSWGGRINSIIAWSRLFNNQELVVAINTDPDHALTAWVTVDHDLNVEGKKVKCLFSTDDQLIGRELPVEAKNGKTVLMTVPAAGCVVYG